MFLLVCRVCRKVWKYTGQGLPENLTCPHCHKILAVVRAVPRNDS